MNKYVQKANAEIVKALSTGDDVVLAKVDKLYVVTIRPFAVGHILTEEQIFFAVDKAKYNAKLSEEAFTELLNIKNTVAPENQLTATGNYYTPNGKTFLKELKSDKCNVWVNSAFVKDLEPFCTYFQESAETAKANRECLPVLVIMDGDPVRIVLPMRKF